MTIPKSPLRSDEIPVLFFAAVFFACMICDHPAFAQIRYITVDANASVDAKPDRIKFMVSLNGDGMTAKDAKAAYDELKTKFNTSFDVMKFKGMSKKSIQKSISDSQFGQPFRGRFGGGGGAAPPEEGQFYVSELVELTVDGIDKLTEKEIDQMTMKYLVELKKLDLMPLNGFTSALKANAEAKKKVLVEAMGKAKKQASLIAELSGGKVGRVLSVEQTEFALVRSKLADYFLERLEESGFGGELGGGISPSVKISTKIRVKFELKD